MPNILTIPLSSTIYFSDEAAGSSTTPSLSSNAVSIGWDEASGIRIYSADIAVNNLDRLSVDGANGRLFNVSDNLTGDIFSVNDAAGLPIINVNSLTSDIVNIGTYGSNALVVNDTNVGIGTATPSHKLEVSGGIRSTSTDGIGYATGAGGTVTQLTSKSTGVTINKVCGTITTHNAALANKATVTFTVTNSTVSSGDTIICHHNSGGTIGAYNITPNTVSNGSFNITIRNVTTGSLSQALSLRFAIIKSTTS